MTAKAISFTPDVLKAKLRALEEYGRCMTRRPMTASQVGWLMANDQSSTDEIAPFRSGQTLWIRERARVLEFAYGASGPMVRLAYELDSVASPWIPYPRRLKEPVVGHCIPNGVHREGARHFLEVVEVRAEMVAEISEQDARLEGALPVEPGDGIEAEWLAREWNNRAYAAGFARMWASIYGPDLDRWCWVYTLKRAEP